MASEVVSAPAAPELEADAAAALLHLAREAVVAAIRRRPPPGIDPAAMPPVLLAPAAAFVTLHERGELRGCMGNLEFERPLWRNVLIAGTIVPLEDPRFMPVVESELSAIRIEVSVLAPPVELPGPEAFDARSQGIIVERSGRRALLLPAQKRGGAEEVVLRRILPNPRLKVVQRLEEQAIDVHAHSSHQFEVADRDDAPPAGLGTLGPIVRLQPPRRSVHSAGAPGGPSVAGFLAALIGGGMQPGRRSRR